MGQDSVFVVDEEKPIEVYQEVCRCPWCRCELCRKAWCDCCALVQNARVWDLFVMSELPARVSL